LIVIYTPQVTNRIKFVLDFIFNQYFGIEINLIENPVVATSSNFLHINYSNISQEGFYQIFQHRLLLEENIQPQKITISHVSDLPVFFQTTENCEVPFDIFSCIFYLISRYEEYLPHQKDAHGRYLSSNSILAHPDFNFAPIVEYWLNYLKEQLLLRQPNLIFKNQHFQYIPTFDIDNAFQYLERNWIKRPPNVFKPEVLKSLMHIQKDAYDIFEKLLNEINQHKFPSIFFFLLNDSIKQNSNVNPTSDELKNLIQKIAALHETGIHPSYYSLEENTIQSEIKLLKSITKTAVSKSRQHFIKISFPTYFNALLSAGIQIDFSLCYPERSGFRAGCSQPFYFFDVEKNETTTLLLQPSCFMDATFEYYQTPESQNLHQNFFIIYNQLTEISGNLVPIFHNDLLAKEKYWSFYTFINKTIQQANEFKRK
jgi:hypothetical protein